MKTFMKTASLVMITAFVILAMAAQGNAAWPERPVTVVIQYKAGGGTDTLTRAYTKAMEKALGVTVNAVNRPGAIGSLAMDFVSQKPADGYWWLGASQFSKPIRVMGHSKLVAWKDWQYYKCASGLQAWAVRPDSPFKTFSDLLNGIRKNPGKYKFSKSARTRGSTSFQTPVKVVSGMREMSFSSRKRESRFVKSHIRAVSHRFWPASRVKSMWRQVVFMNRLNLFEREN
jgi:tripartite-type tricarboxylate transporter receptor subunit TctC